jgi:cyclophilin family peptidyl-prolyl cis-trans isomerase
MKTIPYGGGQSDYTKQINDIESSASRYAGSTAEPFVMNVLGNLYFKSGNIDKAEEVFKTLQQRFSNHYLVSQKAVPPKEGKPQVELALADIQSERNWKQQHPPKVKTRPKPAPEIKATLETSEGNVTLGFFKEQAPQHVENFLKRCREGLYEGTTFHQVIPGQKIQGGDPNSKDEQPENDGQGGFDVTLAPEKTDAHMTAGTLAMAAAPGGSSSSNAQFFILVEDQMALDGKAVAFGEVLEGMDVVKKISSVPTIGPNDKHIPADRPTTNVVIKKVAVVESPPK